MTDSLIPYSFIPGTKAKAQEVNANFIALANSITENTTTLNSNKLNKDLSNITQTGINVIKNNSAPSRNIGEIITSTIPLTDSGLHLLDGALLSGLGSYSAFVEYIADLVTDYPDLFETEANWQSSVSTYGVCGKFVYDDVNNTVRLPKITGILDGTTDVTALGDLVEAGLPNITGSAGANLTAGASGAFYGSSTATRGSIGTGSNQYQFVSFDASRFNSIYGNSLTVQPQSIKVLYYIVIATSTKTDVQADIDEIATDLNGKLDTDGSNTPNKLSNDLLSRFMPDYSAGINLSGSSYTAPAIGFVTIHPAGGNGGIVYVNGYRIGVGSNTNADGSVSFHVSKSDVITISSGYTFGSNRSYFYPLKGAN